MARQAWHRTSYPGVRYREHPTRKIKDRRGKDTKMADRYYVIRFKLDGKLVGEGVGWHNEGVTPESASEERAQLTRARRLGVGAVTLKERRTIAAAERAQGVIFKDFWEKDYPPRQAEKRESSVKTEKSYYKTWIKPVLEKVPVNKVGSLHVERIKKKMRDGGRSARTIEYAIAIVRQAFNLAIRLRIVTANPCAGVEKPKVSNARLRFLSAKEADELLATLRTHEADLADMTLLSIHAGLRAGEVISLSWGDVDLNTGTLLIRDTKNAEPRSALLST